MSRQLFYRVLNPSLGRHFLTKLPKENSLFTQGSKRTTLSRTFKNIRCSSSKAGAQGSSFISENVLMFTGLGLFGGVLFYVSTFTICYNIYLIQTLQHLVMSKLYNI